MTRSGVTPVAFLGGPIADEILSGGDRDERAMFRPDRFHRENATAAAPRGED
ncbi:hypothetical protein [Bosea sp. ANAM02]|uniref:hypothetical protein n=1 Tax=Bosea sp. ANAM02 TaxID=2020412 RepID=UPI000A520FA4|nr:hypothetical protein [Bosea sp. ANAM02]